MDHSHHHHHHGASVMENVSQTVMDIVQSTDPTVISHGRHHMVGGMSGDMGGGGHMMSMSFHFGYDETVLFDVWKISTIAGLIGSMIGIFFLAAFYEGLKYFREFLLWKAYSSLQYQSVQVPPGKPPTENNKTVKPSMLSVSHALQTILHIFQITISYFLMLIFMTYNVWLCIAVVAGAAVGYFLFGWRKTILHDVTEHCH